MNEGRDAEARIRTGRLGEEAITGLANFLRRPRPYVIAHRGASKHSPENTLEAFQRALDEGADALETDLWLSTDGHIVCHHDDTAERMAADPRRIDSLSLSELRSLAVAGGRSKIPTLDELIEITPSDRLLVLELKDPRLASPEGAARLIESLGERVRNRQAAVISFELPWLRALKSIDPRLAVGHITMRNPFPTQPTELLGPYWRLLMLNPLYMRMAKRRGQWVAPLDPDLHKRLPHYLRIEVDAVLTSDPAETRQEIDRLRGSFGA